MASEDERIISVRAEDKGSEVVIQAVVDGLQVTTFGNKAKNGVVSCKIEPQGFDLTVMLKDKSKETKFRKVVKKLPGSVDTDKSKWKVEKGKVVITLVKAKQESWAAQLSMRGLEQESSDEEDDD